MNRPEPPVPPRPPEEAAKLFAFPRGQGPRRPFNTLIEAMVVGEIKEVPYKYRTNCYHVRHRIDFRVQDNHLYIKRIA